MSFDFFMFKTFTLKFFSRYYEAVIEDITEDGEQVSVKFDHSGVVEVTVFAFLKPIRHKSAKKKEERKQSESQREYQKRRKLKKQTRHKQLEEEREHEKNKWLNFTAKATVNYYHLPKLNSF